VRYYFKLYFFLTCCIAFSPAVLFAADNCSGCHAEIKVKSKRARVIHAPVNQGHCDQCHIAGSKISAPAETSLRALEKKKAERIRWFKRLSSREQEHWVRLSGDRIPNSLFLKATDGRMRTPMQELALPAKGSLDKVTPEQQPTRLANIQVTDVRRGISATATLQWQTDEHTESAVYYGVGNLRSVVADRSLSRQHSVVLVSLDPDATYQYQVVARDLFGNESRSAVFEFTTEKSFWNQDASNTAADPFAADIELDWQIKLVDDDYLLILSADRPVSVSLGVQAEVKDKTKRDRKVAVKGGFSHPSIQLLLSNGPESATYFTGCEVFYYGPGG